MSSILVPILIAAFIGYQVDELKIKKYDMIDSDGNLVKVQFSKNGNYSCPLSCSLDHHHYAKLDDESKKDKELWSIASSIDNNGFNKYEVNGYIMDSYIVFEADKKIPKQAMPFVYDESND